MTCRIVIATQPSPDRLRRDRANIGHAAPEIDQPQCVRGPIDPAPQHIIEWRIHFRNPQLSNDFICLVVGAPRFELGTPSPPDWCANRAALRSAGTSGLF